MENPILYVPAAAFDYVIRKLRNCSGISITDRCAALRLAERHWRFAIPEDKEVEMILKVSILIVIGMF